MTIEVVCAIAISSLVWGAISLVRTIMLENKVAYLKGQVETLKRSTFFRKEGR